MFLGIIEKISGKIRYSLSNEWNIIQKAIYKQNFVKTEMNLR